MENAVSDVTDQRDVTTSSWNKTWSDADGSWWRDVE